MAISKFGNNPSAALCWRQCGKIGDTTHIFWDCPALETYWKKIKDEIERIIKIEMPSNLQFYLFGIVEADLFNADQRYVLHILLMLARKIITVNWKNVKSPTISEWKQKLKQVYIMERMTASLQMKVDLFNQRWSIVKEYLNM